MGIFQPGGAGTTIYLYDDNDPTGHTAGQPHTPAEINAFAGASNDYPFMQDPTGQVFLASRRQYMQNVNVVLGGQAADGTNPTSFLIKGCDVFVRSVTFSMRPQAQIAQNLLTLTMGEQTGTIAADNLGGVNGGTLFLNTAHTFSCNLGIFGSMIVHAGGNLIFNNGFSDYQTFGGSLIIHTSTAITFNFATTDTTPFHFINSTCTSNRTSATTAMFNNMNAQSLAGSTLCQNGMAYFVSSSTGRSVRKAKLSGVSGKPSIADIRFLSDGEVTEVVWSGTAPARVDNTSSLLSPLKEYWGFDCKVVDGSAGGAPIAGIPVYLESDINPAHFSTVTLADGNVVFTNPGTGVQNNVLLREWYGNTVAPPGTPNTVFRDRTYTLTVNGYKDVSFPPNMNYETVVQQFEWPGRDRDLSGGYTTDGGVFKRVMSVVKLRRGSPTGNPIYEECEVP